MPTTGYSGTPLLKKLGLREDHRVWLIDPPEDYFRWLEKDISEKIVSARQVPDWAHLFAVSEIAFLRGMKSLTAAAKKNTGLIIWVSWYKKSSGIATDLTEDTIRGFALRSGLVDIKVCAVSEQWSGLKLVVPLNQRK
jgi:hypothetical protein